MHHRRRLAGAVIFGFAIAGAIGWAAGCSAAGDPSSTGPAAGGQGGTALGGGGAGGLGAGGDGSGGIIVIPDADTPDVMVDPCDSRCGAEELCDPDHAGLDDDCDGEVDEGCPCFGGEANACFKGDPAYKSSPGCFAGTMKCTEFGTWGSCTGGKHAIAPDNCQFADAEGCHAISSVPFATVDLLTGTGTFSQDAVSNTFTVTCPAGVDPCPAANGSQFQPLQSGEYSVLYEKTLADATTATCEFPLFVGAPGLRVELEWEHDLGGTGVDLDLHMHQPGTTTPWSLNGTDPQDCGYGNCTVDGFTFPFFPVPTWFPANNVPPDPVNWHLDAVAEKNGCFFAPNGKGQQWMNLGMGCHNPRLDTDNVTCDPSIVDPNHDDFCAPENINVDFPPVGQWTRIAVHYYSAHGLGYDVHPNIKIYCHGALAAELGAEGYYDPTTAVTFLPSHGNTANNLVWLVADVLFSDNECSETCTVQPLFLDEVARTPLFSSEGQVEQSFGPPYP